jgi:hypothetical protein
MILIDGKKEAAELREKKNLVVFDLAPMSNKNGGLTVILIGDLAPKSKFMSRNK